MLHLAMLDGALPVGASMWKMAQPWWEFVEPCCLAQATNGVAVIA